MKATEQTVTLSGRKLKLRWDMAAQYRFGSLPETENLFVRVVNITWAACVNPRMASPEEMAKLFDTDNKEEMEALNAAIEALFADDTEQKKS